MVAESLNPGRSSMLKCRLGRFFGADEIRQFQAGKLQAIADLNSMDLDRCPTKILECFFDVSAKLVVPILLPEAAENQLWGLLVAHQCYTPRNWVRAEIETTVLLAQQLARSLDRDRQYCQLENAYQELQYAREIHHPQPSPSEPQASITPSPQPSPHPSPAIDASPAEILKSYVAYYLSRGKSILSPHHGVLEFEGVVYSYEGYHLEFESFWRQLQRRSDFAQLYLMGDMRCFEHFLDGCYTVSECQRCHLPIPSRYGVAYDVPECALCDDECPTKAAQAAGTTQTMRVVSVGEAPGDIHQTVRLFERNCYQVDFVEEPAEILAQRPTHPIDIVTFRASLTEVEAKQWAMQLRENPRFANAPILALSDRAGYGLPWMLHPLDLEDYFLPPLNGEHLVKHLRWHKLAKSRLLHWFPR